MGRKLAAQVVLPGDDGESVTYAAGTTPPADVAKQITNPAAWLADDDGDEPTPEPAKKPAKRTSKKAAAKTDVTAPADAAATSGSDQAAPPADDADDATWRSYAGTVGVSVADNADADTVKAELVDRGLLEQ